MIVAAQPATFLLMFVLQLFAQHYHSCAALTVRSSQDNLPDYAGQLRAATAGNATRAQITGCLETISAAIDEFLIPRLEWRVSQCSGPRHKTECVLQRVADRALPHFLKLDALQFPADLGDRRECQATVHASGQWIGAATQIDLVVGFATWMMDIRESKRNTSFLPVWSDANYALNSNWSTTQALFRPFCGESETSPMTTQDCFFLPMSSCAMDSVQWARVQDQVRMGPNKDFAVSPRLREAKPFTGLNDGDIGVMWQMLFFRQNARTRNEIAIRETEWRSKNTAWPASPGSNCAAIHVRHGDKLMPYWMNIDDTINGGFNKSLDEYLDVALRMMKDEHRRKGTSANEETPLVFLMSDDADIMAVAKDSRRATIHTVSPGTPLKSLTETLSRGPVNPDNPGDWGYQHSSSEDMLSWLLSIRLMSACSSFVGNMESTFSRFLYHGMCEQRNGRCPRIFSFGRRHEQDDMPTMFEE